MSVEEQKQRMAKLLTNNQELCPLLFDREQKLYSSERHALLKIMNFVREKAERILPGAMVKDAVMCGGIASHIYNDDTDIDVALLLQTDEKIMPAEEFRLFLKKINRIMVGTGFKFRILNRQLDYGYINYLHPGSGVYSLYEDRWISAPVYREFSFTIDEFFEKYRQYSIDIHKYIETLPRINEELLSLDGCQMLDDYLFQLREDALNARVSSPEQEYCMEYQFYRCAKMFYIPQHFTEYLKASLQYNINATEA